MTAFLSCIGRRVKMSLGPMSSFFSGIPDPYIGGVGTPQNPGNFGVSGPNTPFVNFGNVSGDPPLVTAVQGDLGSWSFVSHTYLAPPWLPSGMNEEYLLPRTLAWTMNRMDAEYNSTYVTTLPMLNYLFRQAHEIFRATSVQNAMETDPEAVEFATYMKAYGENMLTQYASMRSDGRDRNMAEGHFPLLRKGNRDPKTATDKFPRDKLERFYNMALQDKFRYLTTVGILATWSYAGAIINTGGAETLNPNEYLEGDHHSVVHVGLARRCEVANVFGGKQQVKDGSKLFVILRRKQEGQDGKPGAFELVPWGGNYQDYPSANERLYRDESGNWCMGHVIRVGTVMQSVHSWPSFDQMRVASNIDGKEPRASADTHVTLPSIWVNLGGKI